MVLLAVPSQNEGVLTSPTVPSAWTQELVAAVAKEAGVAAEDADEPRADAVAGGGEEVEVERDEAAAADDDDDDEDDDDDDDEDDDDDDDD